jgi:hypothetical protein
LPFLDEKLRHGRLHYLDFETKILRLGVATNPPPPLPRPNPTNFPHVDLSIISFLSQAVELELWWQYPQLPDPTDIHVYNRVVTFYEENWNTSYIFGISKNKFLEYFRKTIFLYFEQFLPYFSFCVEFFKKWSF